MNSRHVLKSAFKKDWVLKQTDLATLDIRKVKISAAHQWSFIYYTKGASWFIAQKPFKNTVKVMRESTIWWPKFLFIMGLVQTLCNMLSLVGLGVRVPSASDCKKFSKVVL